MPSTGSIHEYDHVTFPPGHPLQVTPVQAPPFIEISIPVTCVSSVAVPVMLYGSGAPLPRNAPSAGAVTVDDGIPTSAVV